MQEKVFGELIAPLTAFCANAGSKIDKESGSKVLFFENFLQILVFSTSIGVESMRKLIKELATNSSAKNLSLPAIPYSTFRDGFSRFNILVFNELYQFVLQSCSWLSVPEFGNLGLLKAVDGSLFPVLRSMDWANYKRNFKAIKLHLAFNLNTACSSEFLLTDGNGSERSFLVSILERGVTYICDRGYFSFKVLQAMNKAGSLFVLRLKENNHFTVGISLLLTGALPTCFYQIKDDLARFNNDKEQKVYRIVRFRVLKSHFILCTNRLDLTTLEIIMLYAYRWQIELIFKFLKRTLKGLHLFAQTEDSIKVHFHMLLITALLQLRLKQLFLAEAAKNKSQPPQQKVKNEVENIRNLTNVKVADTYLDASPDKWMNSINTIFNKCFKISSDWLLYLKNHIDQSIDNQLITLFNTV
jgi:Transposase DDE domain